MPGTLARASGLFGERPPVLVEGQCRAMVSLTMIVKNEEENLPRCLASVEGLSMRSSSSIPAARIGPRRSPASSGRRCLISSGSTISRRHGMKRCRMRPVIMRSGSMPTMWSSRLSAEKLRGVARQAGGPATGPRMWCAARATRARTERAATRSSIISGCFPFREDVRWTYRVHEQILPTLRRAKVPVRWTDLTVRHTGYVDPAVRARKLERDIRILKRELEDRPDDPFVLFNLGAIAVERQAWAEALDFLSAAWPDRLRPIRSCASCLP